MVKYIHIFIASVVLIACSDAGDRYRYEGQEKPSAVVSDTSYVPIERYVDNPETAAKIAELIAKTVYGEDVVEGQTPYIVTKDNDCWIVRGSLVPGLKGGVFEVRLSAKDGRILSVRHGK